MSSIDTVSFTNITKSFNKWSVVTIGVFDIDDDYNDDLENVL